jgi:flagellar basal body-associated protein FliL
MDMTGVMVILLVACLVVTSVLLGLAVGVFLMFRRQRTKAANRATESAEAVSEGPGQPTS